MILNKIKYNLLFIKHNLLKIRANFIFKIVLIVLFFVLSLLVTMILITVWAAVIINNLFEKLNLNN